MEDQGAAITQSTVAVPRAEKLDHAAFGDQFCLHLDAKGRVILPSVFRQAFQSGGRLRTYERECLGLWTEKGFKLFDERLYARRLSALSGKGPRRSLYTSAAYVVPDTQGRFVIPERLRVATALTFDVTIVGNIDHLEIWPSHVWEAISRDGEEMLAMEIATDDGPHPDQIR